MTQYSNFVKKNIKAGKTIYVVQAFPAEKRAELITVRVASLPRSVHIIGASYAHMFRGRRFYENSTSEWYKEARQISLLDIHRFPGNTYNFHRAFSSKKKAQAYADLVKSGSNVCSMFGYTREKFETYLIESTPLVSARDAIFSPDGTSKNVSHRDQKIACRKPEFVPAQILTEVSEGIEPVSSLKYFRDSVSAA